VADAFAVEIDVGFLFDADVVELGHDDFQTDLKVGLSQRKGLAGNATSPSA
jgi:hypothetical protein